MWHRYDHAIIDQELGYARKMGLNCVRVFLQSLVYHHDPQTFLANFEDFLATADKHGLKVMPILFDSCFGVSPSLESRHIWVANPDPDRMASNWWPESDAYATAVVSAHARDKRIALWDVMNEPTATHLAATPEGKALIDAFNIDEKRSTPSRIRTCDLRIRNPLLYPAELWARCNCKNAWAVVTCPNASRLTLNTRVPTNEQVYSFRPFTQAAISSLEAQRHRHARVRRSTTAGPRDGQSAPGALN